MNPVLFVTVGTTALTNPGIRRDGDTTLLSEVAVWMTDHKDNPEVQRQLGAHYKPQLVEAHMRYWKSKPPGDIKETSAELTSTELLIEKLHRPLEAIYLLSSNTPPGELSAEINKELLRELHPGLAIETCIVDGLDAQFIDPTPPLRKIMEPRANGRPAYVNITGGFKGTVPSLAYISAQHDWLLYYQHETLDKPVRLKFNEGGLPVLLDENDWDI